MVQDEKMDELIREIAVKNGVAVGKRDPIMIVHTMNSQLLQEGKTAQKEALDHFKSELESLSHQWGEDTKQKSEKILNASLAASKEVMANGMQEGAQQAAENLTRILNDATVKIEYLAESARKAAYINLAASMLVVVAITAVLLLQLH